MMVVKKKGLLETSSSVDDNEKVNFRFSTNIIRRLGEELNPSPSQGLIELVKNSYDADALVCEIEFFDTSKPGGKILISDDGIGMDADDIKNGWLVLGRSPKIKEEITELKRVPSGNKGLGRLAALRMGTSTSLTSIPRSTPNQYIAAKGPGGKDSKGRKLSSNSISAVMRISYNRKSFAILPGDLDRIGLDNLLEDVNDVHSWLAVFPHHGGRPGSGEMKSFTSLFCEAVNPEIVVFSIGENEENFPRKEVVETIEKISPSSQMFTTKSSKVLITHIEKSGNHLHKDCVGNISFHLEKYPTDLVFGR